MPLDGHSYLVAQGWSGKGTGLRHGAIAKPLAIPQKKNLSGVGKDRDEAFPFWDHLFTAAASTIKIKVDSEDEDDDQDTEEMSVTVFKRTSTGILSNRRPTSGTAADSGTTTPESDTPRLSLLAHAKREAAKRGLYSKFFRGPILGPHEAESVAESSSYSSPATAPHSTPKGAIQSETSKRKLEDREERRARKRRKKELKEAEILAIEGVKLEKKEEKRKGGSYEGSLEDPEGKKARKTRRREKREAKRQAEEAAVIETTSIKSEQKDEEQDWGASRSGPSVTSVDNSGKSSKKRRNKSPQSRSTRNEDVNSKKQRKRKDPS